MEHTKTEVAIIEKMVQAITDEQVRELGELQLVLVGGGIADVIAG